MRKISTLCILFHYGICLLVLFGCAGEKRKTLFETLSSSRTGIDFINEVEESDKLSILNYMYMYNGGGVGVGDFNNDSLVDIFFTSNQHRDRLYLNEGDMEFDDISESAGIGGAEGANKWKTGVTLVDINADGWLDIYVCEVDSVAGFQGRNRLYINNKDLTFSEKAKDYGLDFSGLSQHAAFFDYDLDGDLDMYLVNQSVHSVQSYRGANSRTRRTGKAGDMLLRNDNGKFVDVSASSGIYSSALGYGLAIGVGDLNNDGWPDIYVSNDFHENDYLYYNNQDGTFTENVVGSMGHVSTFSMGNDIADVNNDGLLDVITLDMRPPGEQERKASSGADNYQVYNYKLEFGYHYQYPRNMLQLNAGRLFGAKNEVQFSETGELSGISSTDWSWGALVADFNNDGKKDIFITNGIPRRPNDLDFIKYNNDFPGKADSLPRVEWLSKMPPGIASNYGFQNVDGLGFEDVSEDWGLGSKAISHGAASVDLDNDGDLDIVVNNYNEPASILRNNSRREEGGNFLKINLVGDNLNPAALGARVKLYAGGNLQMQEKSATRGWLSSSNSELFFGLGVAAKCDSLIVLWGNQRETKLTAISANKSVTVRYTEAKPLVQIAQPSKLFENVTDSSGIGFQHHENGFIDFSIERLIPRMLSREGPKIALGDVNSDGLDDFYIGGAKGQAGELYLQQKKGEKFKRSSQPAFELLKDNEDAGSTFADVDLDGDLDLYVVSGGGEPEKGEMMRDRLYINNGGIFKLDRERLPDKLVNGSCVVAGDFNGDGTVDLFVGGRSVPSEYGLPGVSALYYNDRRGNFYDSSKYLGSSGRIGMVTDAVWLKDERKLIVVGEWMPITIYDFNEKNVGKYTLPGTTGLWNCIYADDLNNDGRIDLLAGNWGLNSVLKATPSKPLELYVSDFDGNLSFDPLITYYNQETKWLFTNLDELTAQLPTIKRRYISHTTFSKDDFAKVFPSNVVENATHHKVEMLASAILMNTSAGFVISPLPKDAQVSPVFGFATGDFNEDRIKDILAVGNFEASHPAIGKCDASFGHFLKGTAQGNFISLTPMTSGFAVYGDCRDIGILNSRDGLPLILISRNNAAPRLFSPAKETNKINQHKP